MREKEIVLRYYTRVTREIESGRERYRECVREREIYRERERNKHLFMKCNKQINLGRFRQKQHEKSVT